MVIGDTTRYGTSGNTTATGTGTGYSCNDWSCPKAWVPAPLSYRELLLIKNAVKATAVMILLGREYKAVMEHLTSRTAPFVLRQMFSKSGHLPKRIRHIKNNR